ncbi:exosome component 1 Csl4 [Oratosquilla oratoria]|uniref:exosome component 1 Csl4 n=1 Tax=Oratosquilla oratoria TaxID=337810 RepID=UPI003F7709E4
MTGAGNGHLLCTPGQRICEASGKYMSGEGTYIFNKYIYASVPGQVKVQSKEGVNVIRVLQGDKNACLPEPGVIVTCRVLQVTANQTNVSIICVGSHMLDVPFRGTIHIENVREHLIDQVDMHSCFRPDDIILARVLSLGNMRQYELSTASNDLGVVTAHCEEGHPLVPASWETMRCQCRLEKRKVAKVIPQRSKHDEE